MVYGLTKIVLLSNLFLVPVKDAEERQPLSTKMLTTWKKSACTWHKRKPFATMENGTHVTSLALLDQVGGDENTVWNNMPTSNLTRFVIFIANINHSGQPYSVNVCCFLFEIDSNGKQLPVLPGKLKILNQQSPFFGKLEVKKFKRAGEEEKKGNEFNLDIKDLILTEGKISIPVPIKPKKRVHGPENERAQNSQNIANL